MSSNTEEEDELVIVVDTRFDGAYTNDPILKTRFEWEKQVSEYCENHSVRREKADKQFVVIPVKWHESAMKLIDSTLKAEYEEKVREARAEEQQKLGDTTYAWGYKDALYDVGSPTQQIGQKTVQFTHTAANKDAHLFIDNYHNPDLCPECITPGTLSFLTQPPKEDSHE